MSITRRKKEQHINQNGVMGYIADHRRSKKAKILLFALLFAFLGLSWAFFARAQQAISVPASIPADCSVDVTQQLEDWFNSLPAFVVVNMPQNGCYRIESSIRLLGKVGIVVNGNNTTLKRTVFGEDNFGMLFCSPN